MNITPVLLVTDKGTSMRSRTPLALHSLCGQPILAYSLQAVSAVCSEKPMVILPRDAVEVQDFLAGKANCLLQEPEKGMIHALLQAEPSIRSISPLLLFMRFDQPLVTSQTLQQLVETQALNPGPVTLAASPNPPGPTEPPVLSDLRLGACCFKTDWLFDTLHHLQDSSKAASSLEDAISLAISAGLSVRTITIEDETELLEVHTRVDLAEAESAMRKRINTRHMLAGVTIVDPASTFIQAGVTIGVDTVLWPNTHLEGNTSVGESCELGPDTLVSNSTIASHCKVFKAVVEGSWLEEHVDVGPYAHLRKGAHLCQGVHMGNFGEVKDSTLGPGTKMGHFSYIGNATLGQDVNIGAGTITCNYDGVRKNPTEVGDGAFIGSDTMLVAPVKIGKHARTGAGAVVTRDVPDETLVVGVPARPIKKLPRPDEEDGEPK